MDLLFKNVTKYTENEYLKFLKFNSKIFGFRYDIYTLFILLILISSSIFAFSKNCLSQGFIFILIIVGFILFRLFFPVYTMQKQKEKLKNENRKDEKNNDFFDATFLFYFNNFSVSYKGKISKIKYSKLYKVYETSDCFYLYYDKNNTFLLNKGSFIQGTPLEFSKFLKEKVKSKYKD